MKRQQQQSQFRRYHQQQYAGFAQMHYVPNSFSQNMRCSPGGQQSPCGYVDSPTSTSYATSVHSELDDAILDEILSIEDELRQARLTNNSSENQQLPQPQQQQYSVDQSMREDFLDYNANDQNDTNRNSNPTPEIFDDDSEEFLNQNSNSDQQNFSFFENNSNSSTPESKFSRQKSSRSEGGPPIMRDRRKKDVHNMIERRRRYNINDKIRELGGLLPRSCVGEIKLNKGSILRAAVEYLRMINLNNERVQEIYKRQQMLEQENRRMLRRIKELEDELHLHGHRVPASSLGECDFGASLRLPACRPPLFMGTLAAPTPLPVKSEPPDTPPPSSSSNASSSFGVSRQQPHQPIRMRHTVPVMTSAVMAAARQIDSSAAAAASKRRRPADDARLVRDLLMSSETTMPNNNSRNGGATNGRNSATTLTHRRGDPLISSAALLFPAHGDDPLIACGSGHAPSSVFDDCDDLAMGAAARTSPSLIDDSSSNCSAASFLPPASFYWPDGLAATFLDAYGCDKSDLLTV